MFVAGRLLPATAAWRTLVRRTTLVLACLGVTLLLLMYSPIADWLANPLIVPEDLSRTDAIVLMTAWSSPDGMLNDAGMRRTLRAAALFKSGVAPALVVCGRNRSPDSGPTARIMADLLVELGVPRESILVDTTAANTREAAVSLSTIAARQGWTRVTLVSEAKDMPRAVASFTHEGLAALPGADPRWDLRVASGPERLVKLGDTLHEWIGLLYYRWHGWI